ncbi:hypothetical protein [Lactobacillus casei str. Zhang] [Lactiplantibacillus mudanjiangensis]|uniref:reverse transcriptase/maturase family protein n=1 Tax=Lactiplantibacillus mudanjiangensis TaxID=1296538 RepID=UPI0010142F97|nr:hypothetical protein [Lactobacillus casei str. Zhang] [Lactiplantibacillus mudanjiangensis]
MKKMIRQLSIGDYNIKVKLKQYPQFDKSFSILAAQKYMNDILKDPSLVSHHRFIPFVLREKRTKKFVGVQENTDKKFEWKVRPLVESGHKDALVYKVYSAILNGYYEKKLCEYSLTQVPTAYRRGLGYSNITSAKEIVDHVVDQTSAWIIKSDFKHFFDNINHNILKQNLSKVLETKYLSDDWYSIFKSVTKYRTIKAEKIPDYMVERAKTTYMYVVRERELSDNIDNGELKVSHVNKIGIPQGTAISATLANVYMIFFDQIIDRLVSQYDGVYRRYSDDFVIVLPGQLDYESVMEVFHDLEKYCHKEVKLCMEKKKTKILRYEADKMKIFKYCGRKKKNQHLITWVLYLMVRSSPSDLRVFISNIIEPRSLYGC